MEISAQLNPQWERGNPDPAVEGLRRRLMLASPSHEHRLTADNTGCIHHLQFSYRSGQIVAVVIGQPQHVLDTVDSVNDYLSLYFQAGIFPDGLVGSFQNRTYRPEEKVAFIVQKYGHGLLCYAHGGMRVVLRHRGEYAEPIRGGSGMAYIKESNLLLTFDSVVTSLERSSVDLSGALMLWEQAGYRGNLAKEVVEAASPSHPQGMAVLCDGRPTLAPTVPTHGLRLKTCPATAEPQFYEARLMKLFDYWTDLPEELTSSNNCERSLSLAAVRGRALQDRTVGVASEYGKIAIVLDGHGQTDSTHVVDFLAQRLAAHNCIVLREVLEADDYVEAARLLFEHMHSWIVDNDRVDALATGTTVSMVVQKYGQGCTWLGVGDSPAVLCAGGPYREISRVEPMDSGEVLARTTRLKRWVMGERVALEIGHHTLTLEVNRSIGDLLFGDAVPYQPLIHHIAEQDLPRNFAVVVASDGVIGKNALKSRQVARMIYLWRSHPGSLKLPAQLIIELTVAYKHLRYTPDGFVQSNGQLWDDMAVAVLTDGRS